MKKKISWETKQIIYLGIILILCEIFEFLIGNRLKINQVFFVFPIGVVIGIFSIFKEDVEHLKFFAPTVIISFLLLILSFWNLPIPSIVKDILILVFNLLQVVMILYTFSKVKEKYFNLKTASFVPIIGLAILMLIPIKSSLIILQRIYFMIFVLKAYIVLNYSDRRFLRLGSWVFTLVCILELVEVIVNFV